MKPRSRLPFYVAVFLLIAAGISLAVWRHIDLGIPWLTGEQRPVWMIEARIDFEADDNAVQASLNVPDQPPGFRILSEQAASPGYGFSIIEKSGNRTAEWTKRSVSGPQTLYFKAQFIPDENASDENLPRSPRPVTCSGKSPRPLPCVKFLPRRRHAPAHRKA